MGGKKCVDTGSKVRGTGLRSACSYLREENEKLTLKSASQATTKQQKFFHCAKVYKLHMNMKQGATAEKQNG